MKYQFNKIVVVGLGYIGLPTAAIIASRGIKVTGVDINKSAVNTINKGKIHIEEPELDVVVHGAVASGMLKASTTPESADAFIVAVPTPFKDDHMPDLSYIEAAAKAIAPVLDKNNIVILESTSPVGTTEQLSHWLAEMRDDLSFPHNGGVEADIQIAYCPERVLPGRILVELIDNDRIIGGLTQECAKKAQQLYKLFVSGDCILTDARTAEMTKLVENAFRDVNIAFANELSIVCEKLDIDVWELIKIANRHPRVNVLQPGPGVGGHCIAVDPWFIVSAAREETKLIQAARYINDQKPYYVTEKAVAAARELNESVIACFGMSFKANIDDLRESPAVQIVANLAQMGFRLLVVEPHIKELPGSLSKYSNIELVSEDIAILNANILLLLVDHDDFKQIDAAKLKEKTVIDTRGIWQ